MSRFRPRNRSALSLVTILLLGVFIGWQSALYSVRDQLDDMQTSMDQVYPLNLDLFWEAYGMLDMEYVNAFMLDGEQQLYGAIKGMVESLDDPFTVFMDPGETQDFQDSLEGTLQGIGAELTVKNDNLTVIAPLKGSPAEQAGLKAGDIIYLIDSKLVTDMTLFEAIMNIRGEEGTTVTLTVLRNGLTDPIIIEIERAKIDIPSVELSYHGDENEIAYISIYQFNDNTEAEFDEAVQELLLTEVDGLILDVRYNGGGYLDIAVDILSDFLEGKQKAVVTKHRYETDNEVFYTNASSRLAEVPLVVLVNEGSASAAEILAGAIQDYERGLIMGEPTFGKGSVQVVELLEDGSSLRYTIAKWYTPNDRSIDDIGIVPDTFVDLTDEDIENDTDSQLDAAVEYLQGL